MILPQIGTLFSVAACTKPRPTCYNRYTASCKGVPIVRSLTLSDPCRQHSFVTRSYLRGALFVKLSTARPSTFSTPLDSRLITKCLRDSFADWGSLLPVWPRDQAAASLRLIQQPSSQARTKYPAVVWPHATWRQPYDASTKMDLS